MKILQEDVILIKKSLSIKAVMHKGCCMNFPTRLGNLKHRQFAKENPQDGYNCPATRQR